MAAYHTSILHSHIALHQMLQTTKESHALCWYKFGTLPCRSTKSCSQLPGVSTFSTKNTTSPPHTKQMARQRGYPEMEVGLSVCDWIISSQHVVIIQRIVSIKIQTSKNRTTHPTTTKVFAQNLVRQISRADRPKSIRFPVSPFWRSAQHVSPVCFILRSTYVRFSLSQQVIHTYSSRNSLGSIESAKKTTCICIYIYLCVRVSLESVYI